MSTGPWQEIVAASRTETGRVRASNQDACGSFQGPRGDRLFLVADGMGGHRGGEVASAMAVEAVAEACAASGAPPPERLRDAIAAANQRIHERGRKEAALEGMGTTLVALLLAREGGAWLAHVGDSRGYRLREGELEQLTADHSLVAQLVRDGHLEATAAGSHPLRHQLLRSVGPDATLEPDVAEIAFVPGDRLLLCSDGLCGYVPEQSIAASLGEATPELAVRTLIDLADASGGEDNVTVLVVERPA